MTSDAPEALEELVFDTKGDVLLILTRHPEGKEKGKDVPNESGSSKRKSPDDVSKNVTMLVSSKHLTLASPVFEIMLGDGRFKEGVELLAQGKVEIELPDDDPVALAIVLNVIHHINKLVPEEIALPLLTEVAILTDKNQLSETMRWVSTSWLSRLDGWYKYRGSLYTFLFISLAFRNAPMFANLTLEAIWLSNENFGSDIKSQHRLPRSIINAIKKARIQIPSDVFAALHNFLERKIELASYCNDQSDVCGFMTTGSFLKSLAVNRCWPFPSPPYSGINIRDLLNNISKIEILTWCEGEDFGDIQGAIEPGKGCINRQMFTKMVRARIEEIKENITGLDVENFQREIRRRGI
ncbi:hypothetical protein SBOR_6675 [Sclerotinia borealis F-4128]|uniref:BTB domain-containing protein n=1 Tax=Sclerotinia borealis (strain F-4128) TaxID=1432307 RepID=W9CAT5_SCLBF|nr:hypothetical protein SBOR_6675 [Sclerotinia borealis F-4128]